MECSTYGEFGTDSIEKYPFLADLQPHVDPSKDGYRMYFHRLELVKI